MRIRRCVQPLLLVTAFVASASGASAAPSFPAAPPGQVIADGAGLISSKDSSEINRVATALVTDRRLPIAVVTIRSLAAQGAAGRTIERYSADLLQSRDEHTRAYGMLLVVAADNRTARIQLGSAWGRAHDDRARKVMDRLILPAFRKGELSTGILEAVRGFDAMGRDRTLPAVGQPTWFPSALVVEGLNGPWWTLPALVVVGLAVLAGVRSVAKQGRRSWAWVAGAFVLGLVLSRIFGGSSEARESDDGATGTWRSATDEG